MVTCDAILLGGGLGIRFSETSAAGKSALPKQFQPLEKTPVFIYSLLALLRTGKFRQIVFAIPKEYLGVVQDQVKMHLSATELAQVRYVIGGKRRQDSAAIALQTLEEIGSAPERVIIHDACRPVIAKGFLERVLKAVEDRSYGAWIPVVPVVDTLKRVENQEVIETVDRNMVHRVQTPQVFEYSVIKELVDKTKENEELHFTDDAALCEYFGIPVGVFAGDVRNIKLTYDFEMETLRQVIQESKDIFQERTIPCVSESDTTFTA